MIKVLIADNQTLTYEGLISILSGIKAIQVVGRAVDFTELDALILKLKPDIIIIDHNLGDDFEIQFQQGSFIRFDHSHILILSNKQVRNNIIGLTDMGIKNHVSKNCSRNELIQAIHSAANGEQFFCETTMHTIFGKNLPSKKTDAEPALSQRETEIVTLIADGLHNKDIAEQLFLSVHTVKTHRKNIIKKLGFTFKNAAELILLINYINETFI